MRQHYLELRAHGCTKSEAIADIISLPLSLLALAISLIPYFPID